MKQIWLVVIMLLSLWMHADAASVNKIVGMNADATGSPPPFPVIFSQLCTGGDCPKQFHPSWADSNRFWGSDTVADCVTSVNGGATWANCTTQPFAGSALNVAGTSDGNVVAVSSVAGTCTIKRSINNGTSWTTQFTDATVACLPTSSGTQQLHCVTVGEQCEYVFVSIGVGGRIFRTTDNGLSWTRTDVPGVSIPNSVGAPFSVSGSSIGGSSGLLNLGGTALFATGNIWAISAAWPVAANGYGLSTAGLWTTGLGIVYFAFDSVTSQYKQLSTTGGVLKSFVPTNADVTGFPMINCFEYTPSIDYCVGTTSTGFTIIWISPDDLSTFFILFESGTIIAGQGTFFTVGTSIYISVAGTTGSFYRISI